MDEDALLKDENEVMMYVSCLGRLPFNNMFSVGWVILEKILMDSEHWVSI